MKLRVPSCTLLLALFALGTPAWAGNNKVKVCHIPPGNPSNFHTITISENALSAHLGHGDLAGACFAHCDSLCNDGNACTIDACDASERCVSNHPPVNCDDGNLCTTDSCNPATGCLSTPRTCQDFNLCTVDACDPVNGQCAFPAIACDAGQTCNPANGTCEGEGIDECENDPCDNGICIDEANGYTCQCSPGWSGTNCEININDCAPNPCVHGMCTDRVNGYTCTCEPGWEGINCDQPQTLTCPCNDVPGQFQDMIAGEVPIAVCFTGGFVNGITGVMLDDDNIVSHYAFSQNGRDFCGPVNQDPGEIDISPAQLELCQDLLLQEAANQMVPCQD